MTCRRLSDGKGGVIIACTRGEKRPMCSECGIREATLRCGYELTGEKKGTKCGRLLCGECATPIWGGIVLCGPHNRMIQKGKNK